MSTITITEKPRFKKNFHGEARTIIALLSRTLPEGGGLEEGEGLTQVEVDALPGVIRRYYKKRLSKDRTTRAITERPRQSSTVPNQYDSKTLSIGDVWKPKHPEIVERAFVALRNNPDAVYVKAPHRDNGSGFTSKLMVALLGKAIIAQRDHCDSHMCTKLAVASMCATLVAVSNELIAKDTDGTYTDAKMEQQSVANTVGWLVRSTKGAGIALNGAAELELFDAALNELERRFWKGRLVAGTKPATTTGDAGEEEDSTHGSAMSDDDESDEDEDVSSSGEAATVDPSTDQK